MISDTAETQALLALAYIAADETLLQALLERTGAGIDDLRTNAADPAFLGAVMDFLLENEEILKDYCESSNISPETPMQIRQALPGASPEW